MHPACILTSKVALPQSTVVLLNTNWCTVVRTKHGFKEALRDKEKHCQTDFLQQLHTCCVKRSPHTWSQFEKAHQGKRYQDLQMVATATYRRCRRFARGRLQAQPLHSRNAVSAATGDSQRCLQRHSPKHTVCSAFILLLRSRCVGRTTSFVLWTEPSIIPSMGFFCNVEVTSTRY